MRHLLLVALLVAVAVPAAGCGGSQTPSAGELEQSIVFARDRVDVALARISRARSKDELLDRMDQAADTVDAAAYALDGVDTPNDYEREVDDLVDALRRLAFDVGATADQIRQPGFGGLLTGTRGLSFESWDDVNLALAALSRKGIEVAPLERHS